MRSVLRSLSGVRPGATYPVRERITLGRAAFADVQLVDESVSRFHALIERQPDGRHIIADLDSSAGIRVDGRHVRRAVLEAGAVVEICGFRLRYEIVDDDAPHTETTRVSGLVAVRSTSREHPAIVDSPETRAPLGAQVITDDRVRATRDDCDWLGVLRDVVAFRELCEHPEPSSPRAQFLQARFGVAPSAGVQRRASRRLECRMPVLVGMRRGPDVVTVVGHLVDAGAGGAKVRTERALPVGASCWILVATNDGERSGIAFSARVVWADTASGTAGVAFIGRPVAGPDVLPPLRGV